MFSGVPQYVRALSRSASSVGNSHGDTGTDRLRTVETGVGSFCTCLPEVMNLCYCISNLSSCVSNLCYCECGIETPIRLFCVSLMSNLLFLLSDIVKL